MNKIIRGWVYVMTNPSMPGLVKIGMSKKDPWLRAEELEGTGHPDRFLVEYDALVYDARVIERKTHQELESLKHSGSDRGQEFFRTTPELAARTIRKISAENFIAEHPKNFGAHDPAAKTLGRNEVCYCGSGIRYKYCHGKI